jgi:hypothetical protein
VEDGEFRLLRIAVPGCQPDNNDEPVFFLGLAGMERDPDNGGFLFRGITVGFRVEDPACGYSPLP